MFCLQLNSVHVIMEVESERRHVIQGVYGIVVCFAYFSLNAVEREHYLLFQNALARHESIIPFRGLSVDEINLILKALLTDMPELFWFEGKWELLQSNGNFVIAPLYSFDIQTSKTITESIYEVCLNVDCLLNNHMTSFERLRTVFDWMLANVQYDVSRGDGQTIYDSLVCGKAVCKGLSKGFQLLSERMGIFCTLREGDLYTEYRHVWNVVRLNGKYYNIDVSMGYDRFAFIFDKRARTDPYRCFFVSDRQMERSHRIHQTPWSRWITTVC